MVENSISPFILALKARNLTVEIHHHSAFQMVLSNDTPFDSTINGELCEKIHGFIIRPQVKHHCVAENGTLNVVNIEPYSTIGLQLSSMLQANEDYLVFQSPVDVSSFFKLEKETFDIYTIINALLAKIPTLNYDERISLIVQYIQLNFANQGITPQTFTDIVFLSPSRLASLFKEQTGSSLSKYLLWTRLRQAIILTLSEKDRSLTDIAHATGFYDQSQFNKYMYEMFGMPPKALKMNSDLIEIY